MTTVQRSSAEAEVTKCLKGRDALLVILGDRLCDGSPEELVAKMASALAHLEGLAEFYQNTIDTGLDAAAFAMCAREQRIKPTMLTGDALEAVLTRARAARNARLFPN